MALFIVLPASAVLKEKNLESTLGILRDELTAYHKELRQQSELMQQQQQNIGSYLINIYNKSTQNSLMLYSQKQDNIFDLTYACHEATEMYMEFQKMSLPFRQYIENNKTEIARHDSLIVSLSQMSVTMMSEEGKINRNVCLTLAIAIRRMLNDNSEQMADYISYYQRTEERLRSLNDYAMKRYSDIQASIFDNSGGNYISTLKSLHTSWKQTANSIATKYKPHQKQIKSQWDYRVILILFAVVILYGLIAIGLNLLFFRYLMPRRLLTPAFLEKRNSIMMATSMVTLAIILGVIRIIFYDQNFLIMASGLLVEFAWLVGVVLISLLLRIEGRQIGSAFRIYSPLILVGFLVIALRIVLIPNDLVNLVFPPILLACTFWQWQVIRKYSRNIPRSDVYYAYTSMAVFLLSVISSWAGYTLFSVEALIWWVMQLTCILTITCISGWMETWAKSRGFSSRPITETWFYNFCHSVALPVLGIASFIISVYWAADVFNLSDTIWTLFRTRFIDTPNFAASLYGICQVIALYFLFAYINRMLKAFLALYFEKSDHTTAASRNVLAKNVIQIAVWGMWLLISLSMLHVGNSWLLVVSGGLSTGIGFASKDILENIYYGISLMTGRVKIGDLIECDGYRGTVSSISYTSTMLNVTDGSVIAFQNSQLFAKNCKNLTKNHGYELDKLVVGIAYGSNIQAVRQMLVDKISQMPFLKPHSEVIVLVEGFGDSAINLKILAWVPVISYARCDSEILECIYTTLNENGVEIPFPQLDIHKKN